MLYCLIAHLIVINLVMLRFWFFKFRFRFRFNFFTKNSMSIRFRFRFFDQEISNTNPINLGVAMLNYSGEAGEAVDDSQRSMTVARLYTRRHMWNSAGTPCMGTDQLSDALTAACCVRSEAWYTALYQLWVKQNSAWTRDTWRPSTSAGIDGNYRPTHARATPSSASPASPA